MAYTTSDSIRLLDIARPSTRERVISNRFLASKLPWRADAELPVSTAILAYKDNVLALQVSFGPAVGDYIIALDVTPGDIRQRCLVRERLRSTVKLFCILGEGYLYYGTQSAVSGQGYPEWYVQGFHLGEPASAQCTNSSTAAVSSRPLQLSRLSGLDPSSTVAFTIHAGHFIAITNQTGHEAEEVNWTSYYRSILFPLSEPKPTMNLSKLFRRQDHEGPINDTWTELGWAVDEATGGLVLVEGRKEWLTGSDGWSRCWYSVPWDSPSTQHTPWEFGGVSTNPNDRLSELVSADEHGRDECGEEVLTRWEDLDGVTRPARYCHREQAIGSDDSMNMGNEYIRAKTKFSTYDFNRGCAVELVVDDVPGEGWRTKERLRLRVVSRLEVSPLAVPCGSSSNSSLTEKAAAAPSSLNPRERNCDGVEIGGSELRFGESEVFLWPSADRDAAHDHGVMSSPELTELMCPGGRAGEVKGVLGEEGVVYSIGPPGRDGERRLVFVCFEPSWGFDGLRGLDREEVLQKGRRRQCASPKRKACCAGGPGRGSGGGCTEHEDADEDAMAGGRGKGKGKRVRSESPSSSPSAAVGAAAAPSYRAGQAGDASSIFAAAAAASTDKIASSSSRHARHDSGVGMGMGIPRAGDGVAMLAWEEAMYLRLRRGFWVR